MPAPFRLDAYFFLKTLVEVNEEFQPESVQKPVNDMAANVTLDLEAAKNEQNEKNYQIKLRIWNLRSEEGPLPYNVDLHVVGWFTVNDTFEHSDIDRLVQINGASMLFGAAREHVLNISGRGPYGPYQLPTIHLAGQLPKGSGG